VKANKAKNTVTGLRAAAAALGITRQRLKRHMADGMPNVLKNERRTFDLSECRAWIAINDAPEVVSLNLAPVLDPRDPRHKERTAAAALRWLDNDLAAGRLLLVDDVRCRVADEFAVHVAALLALYSRVANEVQGATASQVKRVVDETVAQITDQALKADLPNAWPTPRPIVEDEEADEHDQSSNDDREVLKILAPPDPRHSFAVAGANARVRELEDRESEVMPFNHAMTWIALTYGVIRKECATIGARVAAKLAEVNDSSAIRKALDECLDEVLADIRAGSDNVLTLAPSIASDDASWLEGSDATATADQYDFG
jgi:hypothetical protein